MLKEEDFYMAEKRMLSKNFMYSRDYMQLSATAQILYIYLNLECDDDGIVQAYRLIQMLNTPVDDVKVLMQKELIVPIDDDFLVFLPD